MAVTYSQQLLERATAYVQQSLTDRRRDPGLDEIAQLVSAITGEPNGGCRQCQYSDYFALVRTYITQATRILYPETVSTSTYRIAPQFANETFVHESYNKAVTADNLTDEDATFFSKHGYAHAFLKDGKPLEAEADAKAGVGSPSGKPLTEKQQLQARYTELFGAEPDERVTIADLKKHNAAKEANADYQVLAE